MIQYSTGIFVHRLFVQQGVRRCSAAHTWEQDDWSSPCLCHGSGDLTRQHKRWPKIGVIALVEISGWRPHFFHCSRWHTMCPDLCIHKSRYSGRCSDIERQRHDSGTEIVFVATNRENSRWKKSSYSWSTTIAASFTRCVTSMGETRSSGKISSRPSYQLWRSFPSFKGQSRVSTWRYRVVLNTAISQLRKDVRRPERLPPS